MNTAKHISTLIVNQLSAVARRGFATTPDAVSRCVKGTGFAMVKKGGGESKNSTPWVPDPVTGYYRPEGQMNQVDPAELRELLLKKKNHQQ